jgi:hypothetical protein
MLCRSDKGFNALEKQNAPNLINEEQPDQKYGDGMFLKHW